MALNPAASPVTAKPGNAQLSQVNMEPSRGDFGCPMGVKQPVVKSAEPRLSTPVLDVIANQLDAFIEAGPATNAAIVDKLSSVANGESTKDLEEATNAMRRFAVRQFFKPDAQADLSDPALKTFARLWPKAEALIRAEGVQGRTTGIDLEFGMAFNLMIFRINGAEVSLVPRN